MADKRGVAVLAFNNEKMSYITYAMAACLLVRRHMPLASTAVICDVWSYKYLQTLFPQKTIDKAFDHVIEATAIRKTDATKETRTVKIEGESVSLTNNNQNTSLVYDVTPFEETLMIDADYMIQNSVLDGVWGSQNSLMMNTDIVKVDGAPLVEEDVRLCPEGIHQYWTTAIYFKKCHANDIFYNLVDHVSENYRFYKRRYRFPKDLYRNDFVFSIANHIISGFIETHSYCKPLPDKVMMTAYHNTKLFAIGDGTMSFLNYHHSSETSVTHTKRNNVHILDKYSIQNTIDQLVEVYG